MDLPEKEFWFKVILRGTAGLCGFIVTCVLSWRLAYADFSWIKVTTFDFSQLLALILAIFSIILSGMFYFKATQTSNQFYDRTYQFTKDLFEKLARIEERFGELLKGIHEDTSIARDFMQSGNQNRASVPAGPEKVVAPDAPEAKGEERESA